MSATGPKRQKPSPAPSASSAPSSRPQRPARRHQPSQRPQGRPKSASTKTTAKAGRKAAVKPTAKPTQKPTQGVASNIRDVLTEVIILSDVKLLICEWIPFGYNHIVAFNNKLGSYMRIKSALFTQVVDEKPTGTQFSMQPAMTKVHAIDFDPTDFVDFEAQIYYPEDEDIVQEEEFGVHVAASGKVMYGLEIEKIAGHGRDRVSLDHLSRLLADVVQDSSKLMETLLTGYQRSLLDLTFFDHSLDRDKYYFVLAKRIDPDLTPADEYLDSEDRENELKQIVEDVQSAHILNDGSKIFIGTHGTILITEHVDRYELLASEFAFLKGLDIFIQNFFNRLFMINDTIHDIRTLVDASESDPNAVEQAQTLLSETSNNAILMSEILGYLKEATRMLGAEWNEYQDALDTNSKTLAEILRIESRLEATVSRIYDLDNITSGTLHALEGLRDIAEVISQRRMHQVQEALQDNTRNLDEVTRSSERQGASLQVLELILAGALAFDIMDRITGEWSVMQPPDPNVWGGQYLWPLMEVPGVWFSLSIGLWVGIAVTLFSLMSWVTKRAQPMLTVRVKINRKCDLERLHAYLATKEIVTRDSEIFAGGHRKKVTWHEPKRSKWKEHQPQITFVYDDDNGYVLHCIIEVQKPHGLKSDYVERTMLAELMNNNVLVDED